MRMMIIPVAALSLGACQAATDQNAAQPSGTPGNTANYAAEVVELSTAQRNAVFLRAIRDAGLDCEGVTNSERLADTASAPTWRATCDGGTAHLVQVKPDGTAVIVSRAGK